MLAAEPVATNTSVVRERHRTTSRGCTRFIQTPTSLLAASSKAMVFEPSRAQVARLAPTQVGGDAGSIIDAGSTGRGAGTVLDATEGAVLDAAGEGRGGSGLPIPARPTVSTAARTTSTPATASVQPGNRRRSELAAIAASARGAFASLDRSVVWRTGGAT